MAEQISLRADPSALNDESGKRKDKMKNKYIPVVQRRTAAQWEQVLGRKLSTVERYWVGRCRKASEADLKVLTRSPAFVRWTMSNEGQAFFAASITVLKRGAK